MMIIRGDEVRQCGGLCRVPCVERDSRNRLERIQCFREIVSTWLWSRLLSQKL